MTKKRERDVQGADGVRVEMVKGGGMRSGSRAGRALLVLVVLFSFSPASGEPADTCAEPSCAEQEAHLCPVVTDRRGDAGVLRRRFSGRLLVENQPALDILAAGAETSPDAITVSVRLDDLTARRPLGFRMMGWTVSWLDGPVRRFAQAERSRSGVTFRYGVAVRRKDALTGPTFGGYAATGVIDVAEGLVRIDVPRAALGLPPDGSSLAGFGAVSWLLRSTLNTAAHRSIDRTSVGSYRVGPACSA